MKSLPRFVPAPAVAWLIAWPGFRLKSSGLRGGVSHLAATPLRDDPEMGRVFRPHYELTYEKLKSYGFDPHAEVLDALEVL